MTDPRLIPGNCHKCGLPHSENPHPEAGRPSHLLNVGCPKECIPCLVLSRHQWAQRAMKAENELRELKQETQHEHDEKEAVNLDEALRVFEQAACHDTYRMRDGVAAVIRYASKPVPDVVDEQFTRAWINLDALPGSMMHSSQIGKFGPIAASTSCWITTSEKEAERMREKGPVLAIFTHPAK